MTERLDTGEALRSFYETRYEGAYMEAHPLREAERLQDVLSLVPAASIGTVIDYGCGRGAWFPLLTETFPAAALTGVEISRTALARAQRAFPDVELLAFDGVRAPCEDGSFDLLFSYHVLEHALDLEATLGDMARLVAPGGYLVLALPCGDRGSLEERLVRLTGAAERSSTGELRFAYEDPGHLRRATSGEVISLAEQNGLRSSASMFANHFWGGIDVLLVSGPGVIRSLLDPRRADAAMTRTLVALLRAALLAAYALSRAYHLGARGRPRRRPAAKAVFPFVRAARPLLAPGFRGLEALTRREWRSRRHEPGGSAQYLIFRREDTG